MGVKKFSDLTWYYSSGNTFFFANIDDATPNDNFVTESYENIGLKYDSQMGSAPNMSIGYTASGGALQIKVKRTDCTNVSDFVSASGNEKIVYEKSNKTDTPLTEDQVAELKKLKTYTDETNISTDTLASMDVTHYANNDNASTVAGIQKQVLVDKLSDYHVYSTEEKVVGEWIDGKKLYEKSFHFQGTFRNSHNLDVDFDYDFVLYMPSVIKRNDGVYIPLPNPTYQPQYTIGGNLSSKTYQLRTGDFYASGSYWFTDVYLTFRYTKPTATPSLASEPMMASEVTPIEIAGEVDDGAVVNPDSVDNTENM